MLHLGAGAHFDEEAIDHALRLVSSTSPSSLLLASLDAARRHAVLNGAELLERAVSELAALRARIRAIRGLEVLDERLVGSFGIAAIDPLRVCVDVRAAGVSGHEVARRMRHDDDVHVELCGEHVVVAVFGLGEPVERHGAQLVASLARACARPRRRFASRGGRPDGPRARGAPRPCRRARHSWPRASACRSPRPAAASPPSAWPPIHPASPM